MKRSGASCLNFATNCASTLTTSPSPTSHTRSPGGCSSSPDLPPLRRLVLLRRRPHLSRHRLINIGDLRQKAHAAVAGWHDERAEERPAVLQRCFESGADDVVED